MGVRGLTGYIARNAEQYLMPYELHDCYLAIDGDSLACNMYKDVTGAYSAFGGDYDDFYRAVLEFFHVLKECNVQAYVLMDGGYEQRKLRTVAKRLRSKITAIKRINPCASISVFPLMMKEVFVDAVRESGVPVMRCLFEADDELAALSRKLNCPVLSYDSDFYIHNVQYIPLITLTVKAHTKVLKEKEQGNVDNAATQPKRNLRKNEARHIEKLTNANRIMGDICINNVEKRAQKKGKSYKYLDCCMYRIEHLITRRSLSKEKLPLFAALLGNDYISRSAFKNFFATGLGKIGRSRKTKQQQRRIRVILEWLKNETAVSALSKILMRLKQHQRESLQAQVDAAISGYSNEKCTSYDFFVRTYENAFKDIDFTANEDDYEDYVEVEEEEDVSEHEEESSTDVEVGQSSKNEVASADENELDEDTNATTNTNNIVTNVGDNVDEKVEDEVEEEVDEEVDEDVDEDDEYDEEEEEEPTEFPTWFLNKLYPANLPRFVVDLMHLKKYINSPQIEHFPYNDCNEIALPILIYVFTLLHTVKDENSKELLACNSESPVSLTYLGRTTKITNIRYQNFPITSALKYAFEPDKPNPLLFQEVFINNIKDLDTTTLFLKVNELPKDLQLYFLAIIYWLWKSEHCDLLHLHALIVCLVVLRTIDAKIPVERDLKAFHKRYGKIIKKERQVRDQEALANIKRSIKDEFKLLSVPERMANVPKSDCYLVQDALLKHFHMQDIFKKKYDLYSSIVLHGFAEFQSVVFQLLTLNGLLDFPYSNPHMADLFCGVFLYNLYDLLRGRVDVLYYVEHCIFQDSVMMFDFYKYLVDWCEPFVPHWKKDNLTENTQSANKKLLKKQRQAARKKAAKEALGTENADPNADSVDKNLTDEEAFTDLNNKFCTLLKVE